MLTNLTNARLAYRFVSGRKWWQLCLCASYVLQFSPLKSNSNHLLIVAAFLTEVVFCKAEYVSVNICCGYNFVKFSVIGPFLGFETDCTHHLQTHCDSRTSQDQGTLDEPWIFARVSGSLSQSCGLFSWSVHSVALFTGCTEGPIDLVFVIDGSKSLGEDNFEIVKQFVSGILDTLEISPKAARVGLLQYSTEVRTEFTLKQFSSAKDMKKAVSQMKYMGRGSMTGLALRQMSERSFTETEGARPFSANVPRISIVFTDGRAQDEVSEWATRAKQRGKWMFGVNVFIVSF